MCLANALMSNIIQYITCVFPDICACRHRMLRLGVAVIKVN